MRLFLGVLPATLVFCQRSWHEADPAANLVIVEESRKAILTWWQPGYHIWPTEPAVLYSLSSPSWRRFVYNFLLCKKSNFKKWISFHFLFLKDKGLAGLNRNQLATLRFVGWENDHFLGGKKKHHSPKMPKVPRSHRHVTQPRLGRTTGPWSSYCRSQDLPQYHVSSFYGTFMVPSWYLHFANFRSNLEWYSTCPNFMSNLDPGKVDGWQFLKQLDSC